MKNRRLSPPHFLTSAALAAGLCFCFVLQAARSITSAPIPTRSPIELSIGGDWYFQMDPNDRGLEDKWYEQDLPNVLKLPGSLQAQLYGREVSPETQWTGQVVDRSYYTEPSYQPYRMPGNIKFPFWLTPLKHYVGAAWYHRDVLIPSTWQRKHVVLSLERCHWETTVWIDGQPVGSGNSLSAPNVFEVTQQLPPGRHRITLRVDNRVRIKVGENSHSISDQTQGNWNGIIGTLKLTACDPLYISDIQAYPQVANRAVRVVLTLGNDTRRTLGVNLFIRASSTNLPTRHSAPLFQARSELTPGESTIEFVYPMGDDYLAWDEFQPALYRLEVSLESRSDLWYYIDTRQATFGMRNLGVQGTQVTINGRPTFLRGTLECAIFPLTGYPPMDVDSWKRIITIAKSYGLNHLRFHSWCPPDAAFEAADQLGFYFQVECASWANGDTAIGDGLSVDTWIIQEADRILKAYGNHPSFVFLAYGNEPAGRNQKEYLSALVTSWKAKDDRHLYTGAAGWPLLPESDFHSSPDPRIQAWGAGLQSRINSQPPATTVDYRDFVRAHPKPVISHEIGQWCAYPDLSEIGKYTGLYRARNFEIFRDSLRAHGMLDQASDFLRASGKLQTLCYKEDIESALRTPGFGGFQLLDLHDFPGQGTALVGVLNAFWDSKGYVSPQEYRRFCDISVPLARLTKRTWTADETLAAEIQLAHFGPAPLEDAKVYWHLIDRRGQIRVSGAFEPKTFPVGNATFIGSISTPLDQFTQPEALKLVVGIGNASPYGSGKFGRSVNSVMKYLGLHEARIENDWDLWVYPPEVPTDPLPNTLVTAALDDAAYAHLNSGGDVLYLPPPAQVAGDVQMGFSSIFWNTAWTRGQAPHTLGILCDPQHPALRQFPTDFHSNWQWWDLLHSGAAMVLDGFPDRLRPVVQVIDDYYTNRKLGVVFEARVAGGRVVVCSLDLRTKLNERPVARQMMHSLLAYMASPDFKPSQELTPQHLSALVKP